VGIRWIIGGAAALVAIITVLGNFGIIARWLLFRKTGSLVPLLGGVLGSVALLILPAAATRRLWWGPFLLDPGCSWLGVALLRKILLRK
jgi:hypothetical protein